MVNELLEEKHACSDTLSITGPKFCLMINLLETGVWKVFKTSVVCYSEPGRYYQDHEGSDQSLLWEVDKSHDYTLGAECGVFVMLNPVIYDEKSVLPSELQHSLCAIYKIGLPSYCIRQHPADSVTVLFLVCYCGPNREITKFLLYSWHYVWELWLIQQCSRVFGCNFNLHY